MARSFNGSATITNASVSSISSTSYTIAIVASHNSTANGACAFGIAKATGGAEDSISMYFRGDVGGDPIALRSVLQASNSSTMGANSSAYSANTLYNLVAYVSGTNCGIFKDGTKVTSTGTNVVSSYSPDKLSISDLYGVSGTLNGQKITGDACRAAIWTALLTEDECKSVSNGFSPRRVRPQSLVFYAPLVREIFDWRRGMALTDTATGVSNHSRSYGF